MSQQALNRNLPNRKRALLGKLLAATVLTGLGAASQAQAGVSRLLIDKTDVMPAEPQKGLPAYERVRGRLIGEVDPKSPLNRGIQDIARAPRNAKGRVEYVTTFTLLRPVNPADDNGVLASEMPNRGTRIISVGADFLRARGYSVLWVGWQADLFEAPDARTSAARLQMESLAAPRATAGPKPLTGPYLVRVPSAGGKGPSGATMPLDQGGAGRLVYSPASLDTRKATLTGGAAEDLGGGSTGSRYAIASKDWMWWNCATDTAAQTETKPGDLCVKRLAGVFNPEESYTLVFQARDPIVLGLGLAATRDAVSFFRYEPADAAGSTNPLAGRIQHVIGQGQSQVGNFIKLFIALGFNADERGRRVWDGANADIAGRLTPMNIRFATPGGSATLYAPGSEGMLWWGPSVSARGARGSMLDRCLATSTCPKIFETFGGSELWNQRISTGMVTPDLKRDIALPANVRRYFFPGTTHGGGRGGFRIAADQGAGGVCSLPMNPNPEDDQLRALFVALTDWTVGDVSPPASRYPTLDQGNLVRDLATTLKPVPWSQGPKPYGLSNPTLIYDYGSRFDYRAMTGVIDKLPPRVIGSTPAVVPQIDGDGNEVGGVASVLATAPLGSYLSWNTYKAGPFAGRICSFNGGYIPFARTEAERMASGDQRPSIEARYGSRSGYLKAFTDAADQAVKARFLLTEDRDRLVSEAQKATEDGELSFLTP